MIDGTQSELKNLARLMQEICKNSEYQFLFTDEKIELTDLKKVLKKMNVQ